MAEGGIQVPLVSVATWSVEEGYGSIRRKDQTRMATITSDVAAGLNSNAVLAEVQTDAGDFQAATCRPATRCATPGSRRTRPRRRPSWAGPS